MDPTSDTFGRVSTPRPRRPSPFDRRKGTSGRVPKPHPTRERGSRHGVSPPGTEQIFKL